MNHHTKGRMGEAVKNARITLLNLNAQPITVDYAQSRLHAGFGIKDKTRIVDNSSEECGRAALEVLLHDLTRIASPGTTDTFGSDVLMIDFYKKLKYLP